MKRIAALLGLAVLISLGCGVDPQHQYAADERYRRDIVRWQDDSIHAYRHASALWEQHIWNTGKDCEGVAEIEYRWIYQSYRLATNPHYTIEDLMREDDAARATSWRQINEIRGRLPAAARLIAACAAE